jgi:23S rRNA (uridine2552-2'-O)-methyltransferase
VALARGAAHVVGIDLLPIEPVEGAVLIQGDFMEEGMEQRLTELLGGKADLVLSDMAPNTSGHVATDHLRIMALAELALSFACDVLAPDGAFVAKLFQGGAEKDMLNTLKLRFRTVRHAKPPASRKDSKEMYVVATGFRPE